MLKVRRWSRAVMSALQKMRQPAAHLNFSATAFGWSAAARRPLTSPRRAPRPGNHQAANPQVPKFASFRPKPQPAAQPKEPTPEPEPERHRRRKDRENDDDGRERSYRSSHSKHHRHSRSHHDDRERRHRDRDHRDRDHHDRDHRDRNHREDRARARHDERHYRQRHESDSKRRERSAQRHDERAVAEPKPKPASDDVLYIIDRKGDAANLIYGRLHRYSVPAYRRAGFGSVLGLPSYARIDRFVSDDREIVIERVRRHGGSERYLLSKHHAGKDAPVLRVIKPADTGDAPDFNPDQDYVPLRGQKRKRGSKSPESDTEKVDYRSIEGKAKPTGQPGDSDLEYASDASDAEVSQDFFTETKERNALLTRRVQDEPKSLEAWLDLVEHQESMLRIGSSDVYRQLKASERHALASLRFEIYQRALQSIQSDRLVVGLMEESSKIHQRDDHFNKWKHWLAKFPESTAVWVKYLDAVQTNLAEFRLEDCRSKYLECLKILSNSTTAESQRLRVYIFLRLTSMMRDAGYHERAVALWQALFELQLFNPGSFADTASTMQDFEEFWESECPRVGEPGASGWASFKEEGTWPDPPESTLQDEDDEISMGQLFINFCQKERRRMSLLQWPGRTTDEIGEDDPYHVVLFTDLRAELELLKDFLPPLLLVDAFLCFWGLPPLPSSQQSRSWWLDPFLRGEKMHGKQTQSLLLKGPTCDAETDADASRDDWTPPMAYYQPTTEELFGNDFFSVQLSPEQSEWLRRTLRILANTVADDSVAEYFLAFEWKCSPGSAAKTAKSLLKKRSSSLRLYNAYALIESRSGKTAEANRVFSMALGMSTQLPQDSKKFSILLWRTWFWEALRVDDLKAAKHRISSIGDAKPPPEPQASSESEGSFHPATLLKVRNTLIEGRDHCLSTGDTILAVYYAECLSMFAYMQNGNDIEAALEALNDVSKSLGSRNLLHSAANEAAHQAKCQLLIYHGSHVKLFKPAIIRTTIKESISLFPNNTKFLAMYAANEARFRVDDRVRAIVQNVVLNKSDQTIVGWFFSVYSELKRGEHLGGTTHAVRAAFEKAAESDSGKKSPALWASYVMYLCSQQDHTAAKRVFFRGLLHLPYCKRYVMLAFEHLDEVMDFKELRSVYNTLQEKELRVHVEMEDMLEEAQREIDWRRQSIQLSD